MDINFKNGSTLTASGILEAKKTLEDNKIIGYQTYIPPVMCPSTDDIEKMLAFYGIGADKSTQCPECNIKLPMRSIITHLNDDGKSLTFGNNSSLSYSNHSWTFKQIGKWLEGLGY